MRVEARREILSGRRLRTGVLCCTAVLGLTGLILVSLAWQDLDPSDAYPSVVTAVAGVLYGMLGALILRRAGNTIGWILLGLGLAMELLQVTSLYSVVGITRYAGLPAARLAGLISETVFVPIVIGLPYLLLVFPSGTLPSRRWRPVALGTLIVMLVALIGFIVTPRQVAIPAPGGVSVFFPNPLALRAVRGWISLLLLGDYVKLGPVSVVLLGVAFIALIVRYRSGRVQLRQQIKWVAFTAIAGVIFQGGLVLSSSVCSCNDSPAAVFTGLSSAAIFLVGVPVAITIAILKHHLFDIDAIINRSIVYGLVAASLTAVYAAVAAGLGSFAGGNNSFVIAVSTLCVAALFNPARTRIRTMIDRRFYRGKYDAARTLESFTASLRNETNFDQLEATLQDVIRETMQPSQVSLWIMSRSAERGRASL
jgi:hypothetical protein